MRIVEKTETTKEQQNSGSKVIINHLFVHPTLRVVLAAGLRLALAGLGQRLGQLGHKRLLLLAVLHLQEKKKREREKKINIVLRTLEGEEGESCIDQPAPRNATLPSGSPQLFARACNENVK